MAKNGKFCLDVSSLSENQQRSFAKELKKSIDSFNKSLGGEKDE